LAGTVCHKKNSLFLHTFVNYSRKTFYEVGFKQNQLEVYVKSVSSVACNVKITAYIAIVKGIIVQAQRPY
jgi:hypothetical protein